MSRTECLATVPTPVCWPGAEPPLIGDLRPASVQAGFPSPVEGFHVQRIRLKAANPTFPDIVPKDSQTAQVWGVVVAAIKPFKA